VIHALGASAPDSDNAPSAVVLPARDAIPEQAAAPSDGQAGGGDVRRSLPYEVTKRALDIVGSAVGLALLAPVFAVIAARIKLEDGGPVIYRREVVGRGGRRFAALKFRTMIPDADAYLVCHPDLAAAYAENVKLRRDPRVTRVGAVLRRTSLDELPQLVNVLRGEMSLVGPRMIHPSERERYGAFAAHRELVLPGITGLWQVSGRQDVSYDERIRLDRRYLRERSLRLDLRILARTALVLLRREGAY
jgi:undecaprenyl-phosphate galactose phosphotransferase